MIRAVQLSLAKASLDLLLDRASSKLTTQVARLNGLDETVILTTVGSVTMGWSGVISRKVPNKCVIAQVPKDWDSAREVHGILVPNNAADVYESPDNTDKVYTIIESLKPVNTTGAAGLDVLAARKGFRYVVTSGHSIFFVICAESGARKCAWVNSRDSLPNTVMSFNKENTDKYFEVFELFLQLDPDTRISVSSHPSGAGILHLISDKLRVTTSICMPVPKDADGSIFCLDSNLCTTPLKRGTFEKLIDKRKEKEMSTDPVTFDALAAIAGGSTGGGLKKPVEQAAAPTATATATATEKPVLAEPVTDLATKTPLTTGVELTTNTLINKQVATPSPEDTEQPAKEPELTVIEAFDAVYESLSCLCNNLRDNLKTLRSVIARYRAELKAAKKNPADSAKIEALQKQIDEREQRIKKLERMLKAAME